MLKYGNIVETNSIFVYLCVRDMSRVLVVEEFKVVIYFTAFPGLPFLFFVRSFVVCILFVFH